MREQNLNVLTFRLRKWNLIPQFSQTMIKREPGELLGPVEGDEDDSLREVGVVDDDRCLGIRVDKLGGENRADVKVSVRFDKLMLGNSK